MKVGLKHFVAAFVVAVCLCSCGREGKVIPRNKLARIYAEMYVADAWLISASPEAHHRSDTMAFYDPILKEYGYTMEDYWASVSYYLLDPDRFSRILKKSSMLLEADMKLIQKEREQEAAMAKYTNANLYKHVFELYGIPYDEAVITDSLDIRLDENGRFTPQRIVRDTMYFGPRMIFAADTLNAVADTLEAVSETTEVEDVTAEPTRDRERDRTVRRVLEEPVK